MCGILGVVDAREHRLETLDLLRLNSMLSHRGPDGEGAYISPDRTTGLAHRRLSIIDIEGGAQPIYNEDRSLVVVFNGEIYNYRQVREVLLKHGHSFETASDTEVIVHAYEQWGAQCLLKLDGMFAFAIYDYGKGETFLAVDHSGKKPIYYHQGARGFIFASELLPIVESGYFSGRAEVSRLPEFLAMNYVPGLETIYKDVFRMPPGSYGIYKKGNFEVTEYWKYPQFLAGNKPSEDEVAENVRQLLAAAVGSRLESEVPLGVFLSGGIDSSIIVGLMASQCSTPVKTFSVGFKGETEYDETRFAQMVAERFGTEHTRLELTPSDWETVEKVIDQYVEPFSDSASIPTYLMSSAIKPHATVVLTGDGGDEVFGGYLRFAGASLAEKLPASTMNIAARLGDVIPGGGYNSKMSFAKRFLMQAKRPMYARLGRWAGVFTPEELGGLFRREFFADHLPDDRDCFGTYLDEFHRYPAHDVLNRILYVNYKTYLFSDLHVKTDRMSMAHSIECRSPFLDRSLLEYVATLPGEMKINLFRKKYILKKAFKDLLPAEIVRRKKRGFGMPLADWFNGSLKDNVRETLLSEGACFHQYCHVEPVRKMLDDMNSGKRDYGLHIYNLLVMEKWLRKNRRFLP